MEKINTVAVVMVPLPAQGHLNQLLHLARIISTRGLPVHFIGSSIQNRQAKDRVHGWDVSTISNIHFHDFEIPHFITPPADPNASNKFPSYLVPTFEAYVNLREPLGALIRELALSNRRVVVVHDSLMAFASKEAASVFNAEAYSFVSVSSFVVPHLISVTHEDVPCVSFEETHTNNFMEFVTLNAQWLNYCSGDIYNSCYAIEGRFLDVMADLQIDKNVWAIGPFHPLEFHPSGGYRHNCLEWLDEQPPSSVIYISFGTMTSISDEHVGSTTY
ncbi:cis-zeatin O-beta-D-glucosyltransferase [Ranunculus cassubicifolius]